MIAELKPVRDIWKEKPSERHARIFLKEMIRPSGRRCPHCGSLSSPPIRGRTAQGGFLVLTSSKGTSSVVLAQIWRVSQKTTWKPGHAIRKMKDDYEADDAKLAGVVDVREAYVGGASKFKKGVKNKRGRGTCRPMLLGEAGGGLDPDRTGGLEDLRCIRP